MNLIIYFLIAAFTVFADLFTKFLVKKSEVLMNGGVIEVIPGAFRFHYVENEGAAMGSFAGNRWVFMIFSTVAIFAIIIYLVRQYKKIGLLQGVSLSLIMGGGIGNMYERLFNQNAAGKYVVTDFLDFYLFDFWKWVFNIADVAVCVGAGLMLLYLILDLVHEYRAGKHPELYDELVALDAIVPDEESLEDLMALDGATEIPESPFIRTVGNDLPLEETEEDGDECLDETLDDLHDLAFLDGAVPQEEDSFTVEDPEDADFYGETEDFFTEDRPSDKDYL